MWFSCPTSTAYLWWEVTATICHKSCEIYHRMRCEGSSQHWHWRMVAGTDPILRLGKLGRLGQRHSIWFSQFCVQCWMCWKSVSKEHNYRNNCFNAQIPELFWAEVNVFCDEEALCADQQAAGVWDELSLTAASTPVCCISELDMILCNSQAIKRQMRTQPQPSVI